MTREQAINSMISHGFTVEQTGEIIKAVTPQFSSGLDKNSKKLEKGTTKNDCEHCSKTYGTLGCCDFVSNEPVYSCKEGHEEYARGIRKLGTTTKNNLGVDYRSLEDIKKLVERKADDLDGVMLDAGGAIIGLYFAIVNDLPSVTPQDPRWIPVSEYLPVTNDEVLVTYIVNGNTKKRYVETANCFDGEWSSVNDEYRIPNTKIEIIAWCEMPKPYREVEE